MNAIVENDMKNVINNLGNELLSSFKGKKVLISGYRGFLGSNFTAFFNKLNDEVLPVKAKVICVDNKIVDLEDQTKSFSSDFKLVESDVQSFLSNSSDSFDFIIHCAGIASPSFYRKHPLETIEVNAISYWSILKILQNKSLASFLYFSTSEIYGNPDSYHIPTKETYNGNVSTTGPRSCYDESKRLGETISVFFAKEKQLPVKIVRPFNIYGPLMRLDDKRVIPDFAKYALKEKVIKILSNGSPTRSFCYISDALEGFLRVLLKGSSGEPYNIGNSSEEISIKSLAYLFSQILDDISVVFEKPDDKNYLADNPQRRCPDITKAENEIDYHPKVSLREGLQRTVDWYKQTYLNKN